MTARPNNKQPAYLPVALQRRPEKARRSKRVAAVYPAVGPRLLKGHLLDRCI